MGQINSAQGHYGLSARGTATRTNVTGNPRLGVGSQPINLTEGDIAYSFKVEATTASDVVSLNLQTGVCSQTAGSPTIHDGDGKDFEGETLSTMVHLYSILIEADGSGAPISITSSEPELPSIGDFADGSDQGVLLFIHPAGISVAAATMSFALSSAGNHVTVTVCGKST